MGAMEMKMGMIMRYRELKQCVMSCNQFFNYANDCL